jgi:hypothetical protein
MSRSCNKLAFAISSAESVSLLGFRRVFDRLYVTDAVPLGFDLDAVRSHRNATIRALVALATCDFVYGDHGSVRACTPHLALTPSASLPSAILVGARTPAILARVKSVVRANPDLASLAITEQPASPLLPSRVRVMAVSLEVLWTIADRIRVSLAVPSPAETLAGFSVDLSSYVASLQWRDHGSEPNWHRRDFDPDGLRFGSPRGTDGALRLSEYLHPSLEHRREHVLIDANRAAMVNRDWGRYVVLANTGRHVLRYDANVSMFMVPTGIPLPSIFARTLTLCSGYAPVQANIAGAGRFDAFSRVPPSIASTVASRLNQDLVPTSFGAFPRGLHD